MCSEFDPVCCAQIGDENGIERRTSRSNRRTGISLIDGSEITHYHPSSLDDSSVISLPRSGRSFHLEQRLLPVQAPTISPQVAIRPENAMAGNCNRNRVRGASVCHGTNRSRLIDRLGYLRVRLRRAEPNRLKIRPHAPLEGSRLNI